jgi:hypothetical protein
VREALRDAFERWGLPGGMRVDNGYPWGSSGDLTPDLALWLIGLGVPLAWNPPRRPQDNGVVENSQGTAKRWGEPGSCDSPAQLQRQLDEADEIQRCSYPYKEGRSRMEWWPGLAHSGRPYSRQAEDELWRWERVGEHLGGVCVKRKVDEKGQIWIYNRHYYASRRHSRQEVEVVFEAQTRRWLVLSAAGQLLREIEAKELSPERIRALEVTHRRGRGGKTADPTPGPAQ